MDKKLITGKLFLVPAWLGNAPYDQVFPLAHRQILHELQVFIVEKIKTARRFLISSGYPEDINKVRFHVLDKRTDPSDLSFFLDEAKSGKDTGLLSEAGMPCIADPGAEVVKLAHQMNIEVVPLAGPSSIFLALAASGFNGQNFIFHGYLPVEKRQRIASIRKLELKAMQDNQTQIFIETPYRNRQMIQSVVQNCKASTRFCVAGDLTTGDQRIISKSITEWKTVDFDFHRKPAVFLIYRGI